MAINKTINKSTKTHAAMRSCIKYVFWERKSNPSFVYATRPFDVEKITCDTVYQSFLEEKRLWDKDSGRMYARNTISWYKDEEYELGEGFQTLMAVNFMH